MGGKSLNGLQGPTWINSPARCLLFRAPYGPRVVEQESRDLVADLPVGGKEVENLVFEDEGHDGLMYENSVCYHNAIMDFYEQHLRENGS